MQTQPVRLLVVPDPQSAPIMLRNTPPLAQEEIGCYVSCCPRRNGEAQSDKGFRGLLQPPSSSSAQPDCEHFFATQIGETTLSGGSTDGAIGEVQLVRNPDLESR